MLIVELRHESRRDARELIHIGLVFLDGVHGSLQFAVARHEERVRVLEDQGVVVDAVALVLNWTVHLELEPRDAVDDRSSARYDLVHAVLHLVDMQAHVLRQLVHQEIALIAEIVRHRAVRLGKGDILVEIDDLFRDVVDVRHVRFHLAIYEIELFLHALRRFLQAIGKLLARLDDGNALRRLTRVDAQIVPCAVELMQLILDSILLGIVEYGLDLVVISLAQLRIGLCRLFLPILLIGKKITGARQGLGIDAGADLEAAEQAGMVECPRRRQVHALAGVALRIRVRDIVPYRIKGELVLVNTANHRVQSGKCRSHSFTLFLVVIMKPPFSRALHEIISSP